METKKQLRERLDAMSVELTHETNRRIQAEASLQTARRDCDSLWLSLTKKSFDDATHQKSQHTKDAELKWGMACADNEQLAAEISSLKSFIKDLIEEYPEIVKHRAEIKEDEEDKRAKKMSRLDYFLEGSGLSAEDVL